MDVEYMRDFLGLSQDIPASVLHEFQKLSLAYSYTEARFLGGNATFRKAGIYAEAFVRDTNIDVEQYFSFFKVRYLMAVGAERRLEVLSNFNKGIITKIRNKLELENPTKKDKVEAIFMVVMRLRNNALHGNKAKYLFDKEQALLFAQANNFLSEHLRYSSMKQD